MDNEDEELHSSNRLDREVWTIIRTLVYQRDGYRCRRCGVLTAHPHCDHIVPLKLGGTNSPYNLQTLCADCNREKAASAPTFVITAERWQLWHRLVKLEPELDTLFVEAIRLAIDPELAFCANAAWYSRGGLKRRLARLVGWGRGAPRRGLAAEELLRSSGAYDAAYEVIYNALPDCRHGESICWA